MAEGRTWSGDVVGEIKAAWDKLDQFPFKLVSFLAKHPLLPPKSKACLLLQRERLAAGCDIPPRPAGRQVGSWVGAQLEWSRSPHAQRRSGHAAPMLSHGQAASKALERSENTGSGSRCLALRSRHSGSPRQMLGAYAMN